MSLFIFLELSESLSFDDVLPASAIRSRSP